MSNRRYIKKTHFVKTRQEKQNTFARSILARLLFGVVFW